jgi:hypothetical protein
MSKDEFERWGGIGASYLGLNADLELIQVLLDHISTPTGQYVCPNLLGSSVQRVPIPYWSKALKTA